MRKTEGRKRFSILVAIMLVASLLMPQGAVFADNEVPDVEAPAVEQVEATEESGTQSTDGENSEVLPEEAFEEQSEEAEKATPTNVMAEETAEEEPVAEVRAAGDQSWYDPAQASFTIDQEAQLIGLAELVNGGTDFAGKSINLSGDIVLTEEWIPIGDATHSFNGVFDGKGYTISGLLITEAGAGYKGLFGNNSGTVKNFTISGTIGKAEAYITSAAELDYYGGAVAYNSGTVAQIRGEVTVFVNSATIYAVGGIVGQNANGAAVKQCINTADMEASKCSGGVVGRSFGVVAECVNTGNIAGNAHRKDGIAGIVGLAGDKNSTYANTVKNCYNMGTISNGDTNGGRWTGGIVGMADSATGVYNCYNVGVIVPGYSWNWNPIIGHVDFKYVGVHNNYSLEGLEAGDGNAETQPNTVGIVTSEADFKAPEMIGKLGGSYTMDVTNINGGYPILLWQATGTEIAESTTISEGGVYYITSEMQGTITITTTEKVTLIGPGVETKLPELTIDYTVAGADLQIQDLAVAKPMGSNNIIDFMGAGNKLTVAGTNLLESNGYTNGAVIHVPEDGELSLTGEGTLYLYKRSGSAAIGANINQVSGKIIIDTNIFAKGSQQGAVIGSGATAQGVGDIIINGGDVNLMANARGAVIGGGAGGGGGAQAGPAGKVYLNGGTLTLTTDYTGAAIGAGGEADDNVADGGKLYVSGGSLKTYITQNSANNCARWSGLVGVHNNNITAEKLTADGGAPVSLLTFNSEDLKKAEGADPATQFIVKKGEVEIYRGGLHKWDYTGSNATMDNWSASTDTNLYLYLPQEDQKLTINDQTFNVTWDSETKELSYVWAGQEVTDLIDAIGTVEATAESKAKIDAARAAYDQLTLAERPYVTNRSTLIAAENRYPAAVLDEKIEGLAPVTLEKEEDILAARAEYQGMTNAQKREVRNLALLEEAERQLSVLKADKEAADAVIEKIGEIGEVTLESKAKIDAARTAYDALTDDQKQLVQDAEEPNYATLVAAETAYQILKEAADKEEADTAAANAVKTMIDEISDPVTLADKNAIEDAKAAYDALTDDQKAKITEEDLAKLNGAVETLRALMIPVEEATQLIEALPEPAELEGTDEEIVAVREAEDAFDGLSDDGRALLPAGAAEKLEAAKARLALMNHTSGDVTVDGLPWDIIVVATPVEGGEEFDAMQAYKDDKTLLAMYDIELYKVVRTGDTTERQIYDLDGEEVTVIITNDAFVGYEDGVAIHQLDGTAADYEDIAAILDGNTAQFTIDGFSNVGIAGTAVSDAGKTDPTDKPGTAVKPGTTEKVSAKSGGTKTGDNANIYIVIAVMMAAAGVGGGVAIRRRKEQ